MSSRKTERNASLYFDFPDYAFTRAPEQDGAQRRHAVAIVGAGPVGLALAIDLARHGVASVVLEAGTSVSDGSRAICVSRRSLEILQRLGVAERFCKKGLAWTKGRSFYRGQVVFELEMPHSDDERFMPMVNLQQPYIEQFLAERALAEDAIELRWGSEVSGVEQDNDGVRLRVHTPEGDYTLDADYVVACDGARSSMRGLMKLPLAGSSYEGRYLIAYIKLKSDHPTERRAWFDPPANPGSTVLMHKQPDDIWRIDYQLLDEQDSAAELDEERITWRIQRQLDMTGEEQPWQLDWYSLYKAHCLCLDDYRHQRVLFAGDAAHLVPIFGVRGLNSGFADAHDLAWKLAYVAGGWSRPELLDSYAIERRNATLEIFREASKSTIFMTPPTRGYHLMRDAALSLAISRNYCRSLIDPRQSQPYDYVDSALNTFAEADAAFAASPRRGAPLCNVRLAEKRGPGGGGNFLLDHLGLGFQGLYFAHGDAVPAELMAATRAAATREPFALTVIAAGEMARPAGNVLRDPKRRAFEAYGAEDGSFYLARPDGHVCARWKTFAADQLATALEVAQMRAGCVT